MEIPTWGWTILGAIGAAILGPLATRAVTAVLDWNSRLLVKVTINQGFRKPSISKEMEEWEKSRRKPDDFGRDDRRKIARWSKIMDAERYIRLELTNKSKKQLTHLTMCLHRQSPFIQIGEGPIVEAPAGADVPLGDLQPERTMIVHLLVSSLFSYDSIKSIRRSISFSANEIGRIAYQYPLPAHIKERWSDRLFMLWILIGLAIMILGQSIKF